MAPILARSARWYDLPPAGARECIEDLPTRFGLAQSIDQRLGEFSKGMKQKVLIASALMHRPEVLSLDGRWRPAAVGGRRIPAPSRQALRPLALVDVIAEMLATSPPV